MSPTDGRDGAASRGHIAFRVTVAVCAAILLAACALDQRRPSPTPTAPPAAAATLHLGCPPLGTTEAQYCFAIRDVLARALPGLQPVALPAGEPREQLARLERGDVDLAWVRQDLAYAAHHGQGPWQGQSSSGLRLLWLYAEHPLLVAVRVDSGIAALSHLDGAPLAPGLRGSEGAALTADVFGALGIAPRYAELGLEDLVTAVRAGQIAGFAKIARAPNKPDGLVLRIQRATPLRLLGFGTAEQLRLRRARPALSWAAVPAGTYPEAGQSAPLVTVAWAYGFAARTDLPEELADAIARAVDVDNSPHGPGRQAAAFPEVKGLDLAALTARAATVPLHAGVLRYYRDERGLGLTGEAADATR